jgi:tetratricopeptide (TPR) repeat protein
MTTNNSQQSFFQHLWDRRFFSLIGAYLGVSFGLIQFADFLVGRYGLTPSIVDKLIVFLVAMLPAVAVLIYNHGPAGPQRWRPFEKFFIPASLVCALLLAGVFFNTSASASTEQVTITGEDGEKIRRMVPKAEFTKRFAIFPFENKTGLKENDWLSVAGAYLLDKDIEQDMRTFSTQPLSMKYYYESYNYQYLDPIPFATQLKIAQDYYSDYFITGTLETEAGQLKLTLKVNDAKNGEAFSEHAELGADIYAVVDAVSKELHDQLYLESIDNEKIIDLPVSNLVTAKPDALKAFIDGQVTMKKNVQNAAQAVALLEQSVAADPNCAECYSMLGQYYFALSEEAKMQENSAKAVQLSTSLPERQQLNIRYFNYMLQNQPDRAIRLCENWRKLYPSDFTPYSNLINYYQRSLEWDKAKEAALAALDQGHKGTLLTTLASLYINTGEYEEAEKYMKQFAEHYPHKAKDQTLLGDAYISQGQLEKAQNFYNDLLIMAPNEVNIVLKLAGVEDRLGHFDTALRYYEEALDKSNQVTDSIAVYAGMEGHFERLGRYQRSFDLSEERKKLTAKIQPAAYVEQVFFFPQAYKYILTGQDQKMLDGLEALTQQLPQSAPILDCVGKYLYHMWMENKAEFEEYSSNCLPTLMQFNGANYKYLDEGVKARLSGDYAGAAEKYRTYLDSTGLGDTQLSYELSTVYRLAGQLEEAERFINDLLKIDPNQPAILIEKAQVLQAKQETAAAKELYEKAMKIWENADENLVPYREALAFGAELEL